MKLNKGDKAPDFKLPSTTGKEFQLSKDLDGKACIIYFYPKDFTAGCTAEACSFRDEFEQFKDLDIEVIGISKDSVETHQRFKKHHNLQFELLADSEGKVCKLYDAIVPFVGIPKRVTYLLDSDHRIVEILSNFLKGNDHVK